MAVTISPITPFSGLRRYRDTDADGTPENNISGAASTVYQIVVDNTANAAQAVFLKLYNNAAPTVGTTAPDVILRVAGGVSRSIFILQGLAFATALSFACVTAGGTGGTTNPTSDVIVDIVGT